MPGPSLPDLQTLVGLFYDEPELLGRFEEVNSTQLPAAYRRLLDHHDHMTVTVESYHGSPVDVQVLATRPADGHYARKILLRRQSDGRVVQFGIVRLNFDFVQPEVRREIEAERTPLGRVLIEHDVMREVQLVALWRVTAGPDLTALMELADQSELSRPMELFGRTALIYCNGEPAVELLEIVSPAWQDVGSPDGPTMFPSGSDT